MRLANCIIWFTGFKDFDRIKVLMRNILLFDFYLPEI